MSLFVFFFQCLADSGKAKGFEMVMKKTMFYVLNLKGHKNCMIDSKVTELMNWIDVYCLLMDLDLVGSVEGF